jgi:nucleoside-diphosphate-sugar epimerase
VKPESDAAVVPVTKKAEVIKHLQELVPPGSPEPSAPEVLAKLRTLTVELIEAYKAEGQLADDPFSDVRDRTIHLYTSEVSEKLKGKVALVTGAEGCVGSDLVEKLIELGAKHVVSVDNARCGYSLDPKPTAEKQESVTRYAADVRNYEALNYIFNVEKPELVFHLAAQRQPGLAEKKVRETISTSLLGTENIIKLCEKYGVEQCVFSSTGKASRYFTAEVYAASKKVAEWQLAQAVQQGKVTYSMVRFTHTLDNSLVSQQIDEKIKVGPVINVHAPHRYLTAQNLSEARHLLLNALIFSQPDKLKFLTVTNLGWPTETLEMILYKIIRSGKEWPIYFQGLQPGYEEPFFLGQFDYSNPTEIHLLINSLEDPFRTHDPAGDMVITELAPFSSELLDNHVAALKTLLNDPELSDAQLKPYLAEAVREITSSICAKASPQALLKILKWGINPKRVKAGEIEVDKHRNILELLVNGLYGRLSPEVLSSSIVSAQEFEELVEILATLPGLEKQLAYMRAVLKPVNVQPENQAIGEVKDRDLVTQ